MAAINESELEKMWRRSCADCGGNTRRLGLSPGRHMAWGALMKAHAKATARVGQRAEAEGALPLDWYDVLLVLEYASEGRLRMGELAEHVTLSRSGLTRLIDRIEAAGLVERHLCPHDRRAFEVMMTPKGREAREKSWPIYARAIAECFGSRYSDEEAQQLGELLARQFAEE
jgi:DNA-binding MarR family transcriptional regulator